MEYESALKDYVSNKKEFIKTIILQTNKKVLEYKKDQISPDLELINISEQFLKQYRKTADKNYLEISIFLRRLAHRVHWTMVKKELISKNKKFLNMV